MKLIDKTVWMVISMLLLLQGCSVPSETQTAIATSTASINHLISPLPTNTASSKVASQRIVTYGMVYPYPGTAWDESERPAIRERLTYLQSLGINTVIQVFSSQLIDTDAQENWLIFLDEAQRLGIKVVARLYPSNEGDGESFDYRTIDEFLSVVQGHPALLAYLGLHEPLEQFHSEQLQRFYRHVKEVAPSVRVAHYLDDMAAFDTSSRFPSRRFITEICDICIIWYYPTSYENGVSIFDIAQMQKMVQANRALVDERSPNSELWFLGQSYASQQDGYRMPTVEEMETIFNLTSEEGIDGFLWYPWLHDEYDQVLSDPDMELQREAVKKIAELYFKTPVK